jgi:hypothetical protein
MTKQKTVRLFAAVGFCAGVLATVSIAIVGDTFGYPGSAAYRTYETFNRLMAGFLLFEAATLIAFYLQNYSSLSSVDRRLVIATLVPWVGMATGTAAEFWLFSDLPYWQDNLRSAAFILFSLSSLIVGLVFFVIGLRLLIKEHFPQAIALTFNLFLPLDIVLFSSGQSIFLAPAAFATALAIFTLARTATITSGLDSVT